MNIVGAIKKAFTSTEWDKKKEENRKNKKLATRSCYVLHKGNAWNPMMKWPRNAKCFCGSHLKFKKCCISKLKIYVSIEDADQIRLKMQNDPRLRPWREA